MNEDEITFIPFNKSGGIIVDIDYLNPIHCFNWYNKGGTACANTPGRPRTTIRINKFILGPDTQIKYKNDNKFDNRYSNIIKLSEDEKRGPSIEVICKECDKPFMVEKSVYKTGRGIYCSYDCRLKAEYKSVEQQKERRANTLRKRREEIKKIYFNYKKDLKCKICDFKDYRALEFHHRDPSTKEYSISYMVTQAFTWETILKEISKCDVLCSNCHAILHFNEREEI